MLWMRRHVKLGVLVAACLSLSVLATHLWRTSLHPGGAATLRWLAEVRGGNATVPEVPVDGASLRYPSGSVVIPPRADIDKLTYEEAANLYHSYINNHQTFCGRMARLGLESDGGWEVCEDDVFKPRKPCLVYSFGINNDFSFDDDVQKRYGCTVHSFDPSMKMGDHLHKQDVHFHATGLAAYNGVSHQGWKMRTMRSILQELNHSQSTLDILKMDIENSEWTVVPDLVQSGVLRQTRQFLWEIHATLSKTEPSFDKYQQALRMLRDLYDLGFRTFFTHRNHWCPFKSRWGSERIGCNELHMIRV